MPRRSAKDKKRRPLLRMSKTPNTLPNTKVELSKSVGASQVRYSILRSKAKRFSDNPLGKDPQLTSVGDASYNTDAGHMKPIAKIVDDSPVTFSSLRSKVPRFKTPRNETDLEYDTDAGLKTTLLSTVLKSPVSYSVVRTRSPRFRPNTKASETAHIGPGYVTPNLDATKSKAFSATIGHTERFMGDRRPATADYYDTDTGPKRTLAKAVSASPRVYAAVSSPTPRFGFKPGDYDPHLRASLAKVEYDTNKGHRKTLEDEIKANPVTYSQCFHSSAPRFPPEGAGRDSYLRDRLRQIEYDPDVGVKGSLASDVKRSNKRMAAMRSPTPRFQAASTEFTHLGPGSHDPSHALVEPKTPGLAVPRTGRFHKRPDSTKNHGSTYNQDWDRKAWTRKGVTMSETKRPPVTRETVDQMYDIDHGDKKSLAKAVATSPVKFSSMVSRTNRDMGIRNQLGPEIGPGLYDPRVKNDGRMAHTGVIEPDRPTPSLRDQRDRFYVDGDRQLRKALTKIDYDTTTHGSIQHYVSTTSRTYESFRKSVPRGHDLGSPKR